MQTILACTSVAPGSAVQQPGGATETRIKRREGEREPEAEKGKVGWLGRWSCGAAELRDCGGGWFERG